MYKFNLDYGEGILLESVNASWESREDIELTNLVLTNKNIYCVYEKSNGLFKKSTEEVNVLSLSDIKIINGQALVQQVKHKGSWCLQIQFRQGTEYFTFYESAKKVIPQWVSAINNALGIVSEVTTPANTQKTVKRSNPFGGIFAGAAGTFAGVADSLKDVVDNATATFGINTNHVNEQTEEPVQNNDTVVEQPKYSAPQSVEKIEHKQSFCMNCGANLPLGAKFCSSCGNKVVAVESSSESTRQNTEPTPPPIPIPQVQNTTPPPALKTQRQQEFVGTVMKCPNCGAVIGETTAVCPDCGMRITRRAAVNSVQAFKEQLMEIEATRKHAYGKIFSFTVDPADMKKLSLIRNFPIPNSVDDVLEFMLLAAANIEVNLSKQTGMNKLSSWGKSEETSATIGTTISNAWVSKMQQSYQKAEILFPNEPIFQSVQKLYFDKMKELKIKIK